MSSDLQRVSMHDIYSPFVHTSLSLSLTLFLSSIHGVQSDTFLQKFKWDLRNFWNKKILRAA
jgi:hypothetical protein